MGQGSVSLGGRAGEEGVVCYLGRRRLAHGAALCDGPLELLEILGGQRAVVQPEVHVRVRDLEEPKRLLEAGDGDGGHEVGDRGVLRGHGAVAGRALQGQDGVHGRLRSESERIESKVERNTKNETLL